MPKKYTKICYFGDFVGKTFQTLALPFVREVDKTQSTPILKHAFKKKYIPRPQTLPVQPQNVGRGRKTATENGSSKKKHDVNASILNCTLDEWMDLRQPHTLAKPNKTPALSLCDVYYALPGSCGQWRH